MTEFEEKVLAELGRECGKVDELLTDVRALRQEVRAGQETDELVLDQMRKLGHTVSEHSKILADVVPRLEIVEQRGDPFPSATRRPSPSFTKEVVTEAKREVGDEIGKSLAPLAVQAEALVTQAAAMTDGVKTTRTFRLAMVGAVVFYALVEGAKLFWGHS